MKLFVSYNNSNSSIVSQFRIVPYLNSNKNMIEPQTQNSQGDEW